MPVENRKPDESLAILKEQRPTASSPVSPFKNVEARDTNQDGKPDLWVYYDPLRPGNVLRQEEDTNADGDGVADIVSYYENGRLARTDVSEAGMKASTGQRKFPSLANK